MLEKNKISCSEVRHVSQLARLNITEQEELLYANQLSEILESFHALNDLEINDYEKFNHYELERKEKNILRSDKIVEPSDEEREAIKMNFPDRDGDFLSVKSVM